MRKSHYYSFIWKKRHFLWSKYRFNLFQLQTRMGQNSFSWLYGPPARGICYSPVYLFSGGSGHFHDIHHWTANRVRRHRTNLRTPQEPRRQGCCAPPHEMISLLLSDSFPTVLHQSTISLEYWKVVVLLKSFGHIEYPIGWKTISTFFFCHGNIFEFESFYTFDFIFSCSVEVLFHLIYNLSCAMLVLFTPVLLPYIL